MLKSQGQIEIVRQLFYGLSEAEQKSFLRSVAKKLPDAHSDSEYCDDASIGKFLRAKKYAAGMPDKCPFCGDVHVRRNGSVRGAKRYVCGTCGKSFGDTQDTILKHSKKGLDVWRRYVRCMVGKLSLRKSAETCGISLHAAFAWRHKILDALQNMMEQVRLDGVVEADETFMAISFKGCKKSIPRKPHRRGEAATKAGISREKVCVPCGVNMGGMSIAKIANLGRPCWTDIDKVIGGRVEPGSVLVTDSFRGYSKLANDMGVDHIRIKSGKHTEGAFNIQLLNSYHERLKFMVNRLFRGVSTKYLNNYLVWHNLVNFSKGKDAEKEETLFGFALTTLCSRRYEDIPRRAAIPLL